MGDGDKDPPPALSLCRRPFATQSEKPLFFLSLDGTLSSQTRDPLALDHSIRLPSCGSKLLEGDSGVVHLLYFIESLFEGYWLCFGQGYTARWSLLMTTTRQIRTGGRRSVSCDCSQIDRSRCQQTGFGSWTAL
jgi:hypothetical protein